MSVRPGLVLAPTAARGRLHAVLAAGLEQTALRAPLPTAGAPDAPCGDDFGYENGSDTEGEGEREEKPPRPADTAAAATLLALRKDAQKLN
jgi:hypothetical protein